MLRYKDKQHLLQRNNVVHKLNCSCGAFCIGQRYRNLIFRFQEQNVQNQSSDGCHFIITRTKTNHQTDVTSSSDGPKPIIRRMSLHHQTDQNQSSDGCHFIIRRTKTNHQTDVTSHLFKIQATVFNLTKPKF